MSANLKCNSYAFICIWIPSSIHGLHSFCSMISVCIRLAYTICTHFAWSQPYAFDLHTSVPLFCSIVCILTMHMLFVQVSHYFGLIIYIYMCMCCVCVQVCTHLHSFYLLCVQVARSYLYVYNVARSYTYICIWAVYKFSLIILARIHIYIYICLCCVCKFALIYTYLSTNYQYAYAYSLHTKFALIVINPINRHMVCSIIYHYVNDLYTTFALILFISIQGLIWFCSIISTCLSLAYKLCTHFAWSYPYAFNCCTHHHQSYPYVYKCCTCFARSFLYDGLAVNVVFICHESIKGMY